MSQSLTLGTPLSQSQSSLLVSPTYGLATFLTFFVSMLIFGKRSSRSRCQASAPKIRPQVDAQPLKGRTALVTGANGGIGRVIAEKLASMGATLVGTGYSPENAQEFVEHMKVQGYGDVLGMPVDLSVPSQVEAFFAELSRQKIQVDVLVNCAGITRDQLFPLMKTEEWDAVINTNLTSIFHITRHVIRSMMKNKFGRVINIGSIVGARGNPGQANYAAAKAGLLGFSKTLALETAPKNVTVNTVSPGFIETAMTDKIPAKQKQALLDQIPMKHMGQPDDIAEIVGFLAAPASSYITGANIHVNGGMYMA